MKTIVIAAGIAICVWPCMVEAASSTSSSSSGDGGNAVTATTVNGQECKVMHVPAGARGNGAMTSTVTAGPNGVSGRTSGGNGVQVEAGGGSVAASSSGSSGQSVTTDSDGHCTVTIFDRGK